MDAVEQKVKAVISEQLNISIDKIMNIHSFKSDLGADSLDSVSLLIALEEALDVEISDEDSIKIVNVQSAIDYSRKVIEKNSFKDNQL